MIDDTQKLWFACTLCGEDDEANAGENSGELPGRDGLCKYTKSQRTLHRESKARKSYRGIKICKSKEGITNKH